MSGILSDIDFLQGDKMADNKNTKNNKENNKDKPFYYGHRQRLRKRFCENGIDSLLEHEILEFILFHTIPRVDTKPLAHKLIDIYGSLKNVLDASFESLLSNGLSETSAAHIKLYTELYGWLRRNNAVGKQMTDYNEIGHLLTAELDGVPSEKLLALLLDGKNNVISLQTVCEGSFRSAKINMRKLVQTCLDRGAARVVLAHNHPSGDIRPSAEDHVTTASIENYLSEVQVELVEHYIVADGTFLGIKRNSEEMRKGMETVYKRNFGFDE